MKAILSAFLFLGAVMVIVQSTQLAPIPKTPPGFSIGPVDAPFHLEAFYEPMCSDARAAHPKFHAALMSFDLFNQKKFRVTLNMFPLPYHRNSWVTSKITTFVNISLGGEAAYNFTTKFLDAGQPQFYNDKTAGMNDTDVAKLICNVASGLVDGKIISDQFLRALDDNDLEYNTRGEFKYAAQRGVIGTPTYIANGVILNEGESYTEDQWKDFIKKFIEASENENRSPSFT